MSLKRYLSTLIFQKASEYFDPPELSSELPACLQSLDQALEGIELDYKLRCDAIKKIRHPTIRRRAALRTIWPQSCRLFWSLGSP